MDAKEYLDQAYMLDNLIASELKEADRYHQMALSLRSPGFEEHYNPNRPTDAPFVSGLESVWELEETARMHAKKLSDLKKQINEVINRVPNQNERMLLKYRYLDHLKWEQIGDRLYAGRTTLFRWHRSALEHVVVPEDAIIVKTEHDGT